MSGPPLTYNPQTVRGREAEQGDTRDAPPWSQQIADGFLIGQADTTANNAEVLDDAYDPLIEPLQERGYDIRQLVIGNRGGTFNYNGIWAAIREEQAKGNFTELPSSREEFEASALQTYREQVEAAEGRSERGSLAPQLIGGLGGAMTDPINLYSLPLGGFGRTIGQKVLTEAAIGAGVELALQPGVQAQREALGRRDLTLEEGALNVTFAGIGSGLLRGTVEGAAPAARAIGEQVSRLDPNASNREFADAFRQLVPEQLRTPEQEAALHVMTRTADIEESSPFVRTIEGTDTHFARMEAALRALNQNRIPTTSELVEATGSPAPRGPVEPVQGRDAIKAAIRGPESNGDDTVTNRLGSSASGRYQFIESTFKSLYRRVYGVGSAAADRAWSNNRFDVDVQERLMDRLLDENGAVLSRAGFQRDAGNLYIAHFAGPQKAVELLEADPNLLVAQFFSRQAVRQNPTYLGGGKTVGEALAIIRGKVGDAGETSPAPIIDTPDIAVRDPDLDAVRPTQQLIEDGGGEVGPLMDPLRDIIAGSRRSLNQLETLSEELGSNPVAVRAALDQLVDRGELARNSQTGNFMRRRANPNNAANTKRPRTLIEFLAERGGLNDFGGELQARGIRTADKRLGQNVIRATERGDAGNGLSGEGDFGLDVAFNAAREAGYFPELRGAQEQGYDDLLNTPGLLLEAIDEELAGVPRYREDDWDRLGDYNLRGSTEEIYGGFVRGEAGDDAATANLRADFEQAWIDFGNDAADLDAEFLDRAAELYQSGEAFLPEHAIAMAVREDYEDTLALAIKEELAQENAYYDPWDPFWQNELDRLFEERVARPGADAGIGERSKSERRAAQESRADGEPDAGRGSDDPRATDLDAIEAARSRFDHSNLPPEPDPRFAEANGDGIRATTDSVWHDINEQADFAAPTREQSRVELELKTEGRKKADAPQRAPGADGGLFDTQNTTGDLFDLGDGKGERSVADIRDEIETQKAGIEAMRSCMT